MKKTDVLNERLSAALATLGHTDMIMVVDAGFPIPREAVRIDLAVTRDIPDLRTVLKLVSNELVIEGVICAEEVVTHNPLLLDWLEEVFVGAEFSTRPHVKMLEGLAKQAKAIVRTGAFEPWGNIALVCGVEVSKWFDGKGVIMPEYYAKRLK